MELCTFIPRVCCCCTAFGSTLIGIGRAGAVVNGRWFRVRTVWDADRICPCRRAGDGRARARHRKEVARADMQMAARAGLKTTVLGAIVGELGASGCSWRERLTVFVRVDFLPRKTIRGPPFQSGDLRSTFHSVPKSLNSGEERAWTAPGLDARDACCSAPGQYCVWDRIAPLSQSAMPEATIASVGLSSAHITRSVPRAESWSQGARIPHGRIRAAAGARHRASHSLFIERPETQSPRLAFTARLHLLTHVAQATSECSHERGHRSSGIPSSKFGR